MGIPADDVVLIQQGSGSNDPTVVTVNCPDKFGLGCDLCRIILEFGLNITRADFQTDGKWCYIVFWVVQCSNSLRLDWDSLKDRLLSVSPPCLIPLYYDHKLNGSTAAPSVYLLKFCCVGRKGLLHDITEVLTELEFTIQKLKVMTTPDEKVVDLFFITDGSCELQLAGPECENQRTFSSLPLAVAEELFSCELSEKESCTQALRKATPPPKKAIVSFYDILRTSKDLNIQVAYVRFSSNINGYRNMDLFIRQTDGKKIVDPKLLADFCSRLKEEMLHPLRVIITNRGPDTELLVANPVELCGRGRPRVFYDVTLALKKLGICIFSAEIARHSTQDRQWEVYRFLLDENCDVPFASVQARNQIVGRIRRTLMGWDAKVRCTQYERRSGQQFLRCSLGDPGRAVTGGLFHDQLVIWLPRFRPGYLGAATIMIAGFQSPAWHGIFRFQISGAGNRQGGSRGCHFRGYLSPAHPCFMLIWIGVHGGEGQRIWQQASPAPVIGLFFREICPAVEFLRSCCCVEVR
ncbi:ACT DOMAIN-CONTAINING PROTEIN ACR4-RELATED [Salix koriyanagi]|uniref:ACT domain-containing protein ACR n=1 Tax=Salix koriyanagi TaxID=2511006 RepID=A0A9Q0WJE8_9ROSI|nr:ACT DOMAIN-CONTAINING PROTEIN ACR4-RELATED [Salix koriyanagi]